MICQKIPCDVLLMYIIFSFKASGKLTITKESLLCIELKSSDKKTWWKTSHHLEDLLKGTYFLTVMYTCFQNKETFSKHKRVKFSKD